MIFEIGRKDGQLLAPFFEYTEETLVLSYTQGHMGRGWTDDPERLTCAKILTGDFCFLAGDHNAPDAAALVKDIPVDYAIPWILYAPQNEGWNALVEAVWPEHDKYKRYAIRKDTCFDRERLEGFAGALPEEYRLAPIDKELYGWALGVGWARDFVSQFSSAEDFLARGLGYCVMYGGEPVGGASSFTVYSGGIEIQIEVMKEHR
ncbi:MAG: GNAT family N-acetyltransferase, partial [Oscillospiraceae bacterium]|nr:GNAT family N-acetyltransferase [Oscillospiraceae bacterium]